MTYRLTYTERAIKDIRKIEQNTKKRIGKTLLRYVGDPLNHGEKLTDPKIGEYRFRIGDYRVIFDLEGNEIVVLRDRSQERYLQKALEMAGDSKISDLNSIL